MAENPHGLRGLPFLRLHKKLKQKEAAKLLEVTPEVLSDLENGRKNASQERLMEWSEILCAPLDTLVYTPDELEERRKRFHERSPGPVEPGRELIESP